MKKLINQTRYRCDFCRKEYCTEAATARHEHRCGSNPQNEFACGCCVFLKEVEKEIESEYTDYNGEPIIRKKRGFFCLSKQQRLYPVSAERKGLVDKYPETFEGEEIMPKECSSWDFSKRAVMPELPTGVVEYTK
ncbi:hypothetical protein [Dyadobacter sp. CY312]|uniref:hypothetical protein n=1 Tax=Dyadobacter sp. CY312 TaxID=2907303 RepID=UPI001F2D1E28|nr:hypothetical protein [Dyadobacter sp. CY312]MCE7039222.1 hypothetical protein [Dyadobacter sp. CY312]